MTSIPRLQSTVRLGALAALAIAPAFAVDVIYSTTGTFNSTSPCTGGTSLTGCGGPGSLSITYNSLTDALVSTGSGTTSNASFGSFTSTAGNGFTLPAGESFTLTIAQSAPSAGATSIFDTFQGTISTNASNVMLQFTGGPAGVTLTTYQGQSVFRFDLGGVVYYVDQNTSIVPSTSNGGIVTIQGAIDTSAVPEPAFYGLTGIGFAGLVAMAVRRRRQIAG